MTNLLLARGEITQALRSDGLAFQWNQNSIAEDRGTLQCRVNCTLSSDTVLYLVFRIRPDTETVELDALDWAAVSGRIRGGLRDNLIDRIGSDVDDNCGYFPLSAIVNNLRAIEDAIVRSFKVYAEAMTYVFPKGFPPPFGHNKPVKNYVTGVAAAGCTSKALKKKDEKGSMMSTLRNDILSLVKKGGKTAAGSVVADKIREILVRKLEDTPLEGFAAVLPDEVCSFLLALSVFYVAEYVPGVPKAESVQAAAELAIEGTAHDAWKTLFAQIAEIFGEIAEEVTGVMSAAEKE